MHRILTVVDSISELLGRFSSYLLLATMSVMLIEVFFRYFLRNPTIWAWDINMQLFASFTFLGAGYHLLHRYTVNVDVLYLRMPKKMQAIADIVTFMIIVLFCVVIIWKGWESGVRSVERGITSGSAFDPPIYHIRMMLPVAGTLLLLQATANFIRDFTRKMKIGGEEDNDS